VLASPFLNLWLAGAVSGQVSPSSGTTLSAESIRAPESRAGAAAGPGSGSDEIVGGERYESRVADLLAPRVEPGLPPSTDLVSGLDWTSLLLTGQPTSSLLPQNGTSIAPVAGILSSGVGEGLASVADLLTDENALWPNYVIGLDDTIDDGPVVAPPVVAPEKAGDPRGNAWTPASGRGLVDQVFQCGLPPLLHDMISQSAPEQAGNLATILGAGLLLAGLWQTRRRTQSAAGTTNGNVPRTQERKLRIVQSRGKPKTAASSADAADATVPCSEPL
jgi:hypothetical protein